MANEAIHELTAAYALDALDAADRAAYEAHLAACPSCRAELASLTEAVGSLAYAVDAPPPPAELRERVLALARRGGEVVPLRRRRAFQALSAAAAVAACAAVGLGVWAATLEHRLAHERHLNADRAGALAIASTPGTRQLSFPHGHGMLLVAVDGRAVLVLHGMPAAPAGRVYEAWVIPAAGAPQPAGLFQGGGTPTAVRLGRPVRPGTAVGITVERSGGAAAPTGAPIMETRA